MDESMKPEGIFRDIQRNRKMNSLDIQLITLEENETLKPLLNNIQPETCSSVACHSTKRREPKDETTTQDNPAVEDIIHVSCSHEQSSKPKMPVAVFQPKIIPVNKENDDDTVVTVEDTNEKKGDMETTKKVMDDIDEQEEHVKSSAKSATVYEFKACVKRSRHSRICNKLYAALPGINFLLLIVLIITCMYDRPFLTTKGEINGKFLEFNEKNKFHSVEFSPKNDSMVNSANYIKWNPPVTVNSFVRFNDTDQLVRLDDTGQRIIAQENGTYSIFVSLTVDGRNCDNNQTQSMICLRNSRNGKEKCARVKLLADSAITLLVNANIYLATNDFFFVSGLGFDCGDPASTYMTMTKY